MIAFSINDEFLDMPSDPSVQWQRTSPFFQFEGFNREDFTFPIAFPNTPKNKRIFDFPHIVENASRLRPKWTATLWYNGVPRVKGEIRAKSPINERVITANFVAGLSLIGDDVKERKLSEIIDETETIHTLTVIKSVDIRHFSGDFAIRINGTEYSGTDLSDLASVINADTGNGVAASANVPASVLTITSDTAGEFVPLHIQTPSNSVWLNSALALRPTWLTTYRNEYITYLSGFIGSARLTKKIRYGTFANLDGYQNAEKPLKAWPVVNYWSGGDFVPNDFSNLDDNFNLGPINNTSLAPMLTLKAMLEFIETYYSMTIQFFALNDDDVLFHNWTIDRPTKIWNDQSLIFFERSFNLNQLVPDITVNELIKALQAGFNAEATFDPDTRVLTIAHRQPSITARTYQDITTSCSIPQDIQLAEQKGVRFALLEFSEDKSENLTLSPSDYLVDEGERTIRAGFGAPGMRNHTGLGDYPQNAALTTAMINQPQNAKFGLRFARYIDDANTPYIDSRPFLWEGEDGLILTYWEDSIQIENNPVTIKNTWLMPRNQVFATEWGKIWRIDRNDYLLKEFSVQLRTNEVSAADCTFVRRPFFVDGSEPEPRATAWRVLASSLRCEKNASNVNTGVAIYDYLEQYYTDDDTATGVTKLNIFGDPDYVAPATNLTACPVLTPEYAFGNLYIIVNPDITSNEEKIRINSIEYRMRRGVPNAFPYPYVMGSITNVEVVVASNPKNKVFQWRVQVYQNTAKVYDETRTVGPNNAVFPALEGVGGNETQRTFYLGDTYFDETKYNRLIITRTEI